MFIEVISWITYGEISRKSKLVVAVIEFSQVVESLQHKLLNGESLFSTWEEICNLQGMIYRKEERMIKELLTLTYKKLILQNYKIKGQQIHYTFQWRKT